MPIIGIFFYFISLYNPVVDFCKKFTTGYNRYYEK